MLPVNLIILYLLLLLVTIVISKKLNFYDKPNFRKIHKSQVLNTGGITIYIFYLLVVNFFEFNHNIELIISIGLFVCIVGFIDDRKNLNPSIKIIFIIVPSTYLILNGINIYDLGNYEHLGILGLGKFQLPFLILATGLLINATNYIDGVDGLLLTFFICCLGYYIFLIEEPNTINLIKILMIPAIFNLVMNLLPTKTNLKIFSGNTGSLFIGFFISFLTIELYSSFSVHPVYLIWPLWYPVYDFLFVSTNRAFLKQSIFSADNSHLHHKILNKFNDNHLKTVLLFFIFNILIIFLGNLISNFSKLYSLIFFVFGFIIYFTVRFKLK